MSRQLDNRKSRSRTRGGDLGIVATAALPLSLLALSKYYGSRRKRFFKRGKSRRKKKGSWW